MDQSTWPKKSSANYMQWCAWCDSEPETLEKWRHIFSENKRDADEFMASLSRPRPKPVARELDPWAVPAYKKRRKRA